MITNETSWFLYQSESLCLTLMNGIEYSHTMDPWTRELADTNLSLASDIACRNGIWGIQSWWKYAFDWYISLYDLYDTLRDGWGIIMMCANFDVPDVPGLYTYNYIGYICYHMYLHCLQWSRGIPCSVPISSYLTSLLALLPPLCPYLFLSFSYSHQWRDWIIMTCTVPGASVTGYN
jgi:hypothetical protein